MAEQTYLRPLSLAYQMAFDRCAMEMMGATGPLLVAASKPFYAREVLRRFSGKAMLWPHGDWPSNEDRLREILGPEMRWEQVQLDTSVNMSVPSLAEQVVWSTPDQQDWREVLAVLTRSAAADATMVVVGKAARGNRFLPDAPSSAERTAALKAITMELELHNWRVRNVCGFQGPVSLLLGMTSRLPSLAGRQDLVDRYFAAVRRYFVVAGWQASWAPVWAVTADLQQAI